MAAWRKILLSFFMLLAASCDSGEPEATAEERREVPEAPALEENELPTTHSLFQAQILSNMAVATTFTPATNNSSEWAAETHWLDSCRLKSLFVVVHISDSLIDAAVGYWKDAQINLSTSDVERARLDLRRKFLRNGKRAFLLLMDPLLTEKDEFIGIL